MMVLMKIFSFLCIVGVSIRGTFGKKVVVMCRKLVFMALYGKAH